MWFVTMIAKTKIYVLGLLLLISLGSCAKSPATKYVTANPNSINSEQRKVGDVKLREAWEDKIKELNKRSKDYPSQEWHALESLLAQLPEQQLRNEFDRIALSPVGYSDLDEYEQTLVQALISRKVSAQDPSQLVALFSSKCPTFIGGSPIELYLSYSGIPDPLLVLFDSYDQTTNADAKKDLLSVLGHAFRSIRDKVAGDDEFVIQSKKWYLENKAKFELNPYYHPDALFPKNRELFVVRSNYENRR